MPWSESSDSSARVRGCHGRWPVRVCARHGGSDSSRAGPSSCCASHLCSWDAPLTSADSDIKAVALKPFVSLVCRPSRSFVDMVNARAACGVNEGDGESRREGPQARRTQSLFGTKRKQRIDATRSRPPHSPSSFDPGGAWIGLGNARKWLLTDSRRPVRNVCLVSSNAGLERLAVCARAVHEWARRVAPGT